MNPIPNFNYQTLENLLDYGVGIFNSFREVALNPQCISSIYKLIENDISNLRQILTEQFGTDPNVQNGLSKDGYERLTYRLLQRNGIILEELSRSVDKRRYKHNIVNLPEEAEHKLNSLLFFYYYNKLFKELSQKGNLT